MKTIIKSKDSFSKTERSQIKMISDGHGAKKIKYNLSKKKKKIIIIIEIAE